MGASVSSEYGGSSGAAVRVRHAGGYLEEYDRPVSALELMLRHPRHWITSSEVFRSECAVSSIIAPECVLKPGETYFVVPSHTLLSRMLKQGVPTPALHTLLVRQGVNIKDFDSKVKRCDHRHGGDVAESKGMACSYERKDTDKTPHSDHLCNVGVAYARKDTTKTDLGQVQATQQLQGKLENLRGRRATSDIETHRGPAKPQVATAGSVSATGHLVGLSKAGQTVSLALAQATDHGREFSAEDTYSSLPLSTTSEAIGTPVGKLWLEYKSFEGEKHDISKVFLKSKDSQSLVVDYTSMELISSKGKACLKSKDSQRLATDHTSTEPISSQKHATGKSSQRLVADYTSMEHISSKDDVCLKSKDSQRLVVDYTSMEHISSKDEVCLKYKDNQRSATDHTSAEPISSKKHATGKNNEFLKAVTHFADMIFLEPESMRTSNAKDHIADNQVQAMDFCPKQQMQPYQNDKQTERNGTLTRRKEQGEREQLAVMPIQRDENKSSSLADLIIRSPLTKPCNEATKSATFPLSSFLCQPSSTLSSSSLSSPLPSAAESSLSAGTTTIYSVQTPILPVNGNSLDHHHLASGRNDSSTVCSQQPLDQSSSNDTKTRITRATQKNLSDVEMQALVLRTVRRFTRCRSRSRSSWQPTLPPVYECASE